MSSTPPISFRVKAQTAANPSTRGYPYSISSRDLDENFVFATENFDRDHFVTTNTTGAGGHSQRKISLLHPIPQLPEKGTFVLGAVNGALQWIATEEC
jgi:hypothetical protein